MKSKKVVQEVEVYTCEVCEADYPQAISAKFCEEQHTKLVCKHKNLKYSIDVEDNYGDNDINIYSNCKDCKTRKVKTWRLAYLSSETLEKFVDIIERGEAL